MARAASALVRRRGVRAALGALVVLAAAGAVAVANVLLLHVAGSPPGEVGSLSARLPAAVSLPAATTAAVTAPAVTTRMAATTASAPALGRPAGAGDDDAAGRDGGDDGRDGRSSDD